MVTKIKFQNSQNNYSILIGKKILNFLPKEIKKINPKTKKIAISTIIATIMMVV